LVLQGGLTGETSSAALTAYVLISLLETGLPLLPSVISNSMFCLKGESDPDIYTLALTTYALTLLGEREMAEESLERLLGMAIRHQDLCWWEKSGTVSTDCVHYMYTVRSQFMQIINSAI
jgi:hypothetical protein